MLLVRYKWIEIYRCETHSTLICIFIRVSLEKSAKLLNIKWIKAISQFKNEWQNTFMCGNMQQLSGKCQTYRFKAKPYCIGMEDATQVEFHDWWMATCFRHRGNSPSPNQNSNQIQTNSDHKYYVTTNRLMLNAYDAGAQLAPVLLL